ncbi:MAG: hypothetical protein U0793_00990 [Gemmataceae bacterium]
MPFSTYARLGEALKTLQISLKLESFVAPIPLVVSGHLREEIDFVQEWAGLPQSEFAICESLIYPILKEVWKHYPEFKIWSHEPLKFDEDLCGTPDYFLARRSPLGTPVIEEPYLLVVEAKKDDFDWGWAQCLAEMVAATKLNHWPEQVMYGIATNGRSWQFGKLEGGVLTQDPRFFGWLPLEEVCAAVNFMFEQCRQQLKAYAGAA